MIRYYAYRDYNFLKFICIAKWKNGLVHLESSHFKHQNVVETLNLLAGWEQIDEIEDLFVTRTLKLVVMLLT